MTPIDRAVRICGKQSELAACIENAVHAAIAESEEAAATAEKLGGPVRAEELLPDASVRWIRGESGLVTGYEKQLAPVEVEGAAHAH
mgnify:CR=1 FL=1